MTATVEIDDLSVRYGDAVAVDSVSFNLQPGECLAVLGANGAGKSSLAAAIARVVTTTSGTVRLDGNDVTGRAPHRLVREGVAFLPEQRAIFPMLSVEDNLRLGVRRLPRGERATAIAEAFDYFPVLKERRAQIASTLSGGEQQMLAMSSALVTHPRLLICDELSLGLAPVVVDAVYRALERARESNMTIILIEQYVDKALSLADNALIMRRGKQVWYGAAAEARATVIHQYLGHAPETELASASEAVPPKIEKVENQ